MDGIKAVDFVREHLFIEDKTEDLFLNGKVRRPPFMTKISPDSVLARDAKVSILSLEDSAFVNNQAEIIYEDEEFMVCNKPQGMECITEVEDGTNLHLFAVSHMKRMGEYDVDTLKVPYVCNVLPKEFGGLSVVAKDQYLFEEIVNAFKERRIKRVFRVIVSGEPKEEDLLYGYIQYQNIGNRASMKDNMNRNARPAALKYRLLEQRAELSLLEVEPLSFLRDQIPSQLADAGLPVLGDEVFGNREINRRYSIEEPAIWGNKIVFETGTNNYLEYLNGRVMEVTPIAMSGIGYFIDKGDIDRTKRIEILNEKQIKNVSRIVWNSFNKSLIKEFDRDFINGFRSENRVSALVKEAEEGTVYFGCYGTQGIAGIISVDKEGAIGRLYVLRSQQNRGVGEALLKAAEDWCFSNHIEKTKVDAIGSSYLYFKKKGYAEAATSEEKYHTLLEKSNLY